MSVWTINKKPVYAPMLSTFGGGSVRGFGGGGAAGGGAGLGDRALFSGGQNGFRETIDTIEITTTGNATDFGDLSIDHERPGACGDTTRGLLFGGQNSGGRTNTIEYLTYASTGSGTDFGDMQNNSVQCSGYNNDTRGVMNEGNNGSYTNIIDYVTIQSTGNASDFGDLTVARGWDPAAFSSNTRGITAGGSTSASASNIIDYTTIASGGNATDFGDTTIGYGIYASCGASSPTRGLIFVGQYSDGPLSNAIHYVTTASTGNSVDFGDLTNSRYFAAGASTHERAVCAGGLASGVYQDRIDYVTIDTTGNATDFGDLTVGRSYIAGSCAGNGGLSA